MIVDILKKLGRLILLVIVSTLLASLYGFLHNRVTFSISSEYFTEFKFYQFSVLDYIIENDDLKKASFVGIMATWWVGALIGAVITFSSFFLIKLKFINFLKAISLCIVITILFSFIGYFVGISSTDDLGFEPDFLNGLFNKKDFITVATMHNYSYLGGFIGLVGSVIYLVLADKANGMTLWHPRRRSE